MLLITWLKCVERACANVKLRHNTSLVCLQTERGTSYYNSCYHLW